MNNVKYLLICCSYDFFFLQQRDQAQCFISEQTSKQIHNGMKIAYLIGYVANHTLLQ